jgi:hypothetical protein
MAGARRHAGSAAGRGTRACGLDTRRAESHGARAVCGLGSLGLRARDLGKARGRSQEGARAGADAEVTVRRRRGRGGAGHGVGRPENVLMFSCLNA